MPPFCWPHIIRRLFQVDEEHKGRFVGLECQLPLGSLLELAEPEVIPLYVFVHQADYQLFEVRFLSLDH